VNVSIALCFHHQPVGQIGSAKWGGLPMIFKPIVHFLIKAPIYNEQIWGWSHCRTAPWRLWWPFSKMAASWLLSKAYLMENKM